MGNTPQPPAPKVKSFLDIATSFPADMSAETYDAARSKYFSDVIRPKIQGGANIAGAWTQFKAMTERPHLLDAAGRAGAAVQLGATSAALQVTRPLRLIDEMSGTQTATRGVADLEEKERQLTKVGDREGLRTGLIKGAGAAAGQIAGFEALGEVMNPLAGELISQFGMAARTAKLAQATLKGGMTFGTLDALDADAGGRMVAGVKGFGIGAGADLVLGAGGLLVKRGLSGTRDEVEALIKRTASGVKPPAEVDTAMAQKTIHDAEVSRVEGRSQEVQYTTGQRGARIVVEDVSGAKQSLEIKPGREYDTYQQMKNMVNQGGHVSHIQVHPEDQSVLNEFLRIQKGVEEAKYNATTVRTQPGAAEAVAARANTEGVHAEAISKDTVQVHVVQAEVPKSTATKPVVERPPARVQPTNEELGDALIKGGAQPKDIGFLVRQMQKTWEEHLPDAEKQRGIEVGIKYAPHMLPDQYSEYTLPRITNKASYMNGQVDANAVQAKVEAVGEKTLGYPIKVTDVLVGDNPNKVKVYLRPDADPQVNESIRTALKGKLGPAYDIDFSMRPKPELRRYDILGSQGARTVAPRVLSDDKINDLLDFWDLKPGDVDVDKLMTMTEQQAAKELEAVKSRVEDIGRGERTAEQRTRVTTEDRRPPSERAKLLMPGDGLRKGVEDATESQFLRPNQGILRIRPGGYKIITTPEMLSGAQAAASPSFELARYGMDIDIPESAGDVQGPVVMLREGPVVPEHVYHENLHANIMHADAHEDFDKLIPLDQFRTGLQIGKGLNDAYPGYQGMGPKRMMNEAFVHAAQAVRFGDDSYLRQLAEWDTSKGHVLEFVNQTAQKLLQHTLDGSGDSIPVRNLQRQVTDLIRRTSTDVSYELRNGVAITGSGSNAWYDPARGWVLKESESSEKVFNTIHDLWNHLDSNDKNFLSPSYTFIPERMGVRGAMTPPGAEPNGSEPPNPELPLRSKFAWNAISAFWRPTLPWASSLDVKVNEVFRSKGIRLPIYDSFKAVDEGAREGTQRMIDWTTESGNILNHFDDKKLYSVMDYLGHGEKARTLDLGAKYGLSQEDMQYAHLYWNFLKDFDKATGIDTTGFLVRDLPRLRSGGFDPTGVWPDISEKNAGTFERLVKYDQTLNPRDIHAGRFNQLMLKEGMEKLYTGEPLKKLNALISKKDAAGEMLLPSNIRYPMQKYHDYMKGIPDQSQQAIEAAVGKFFSVMNNHMGQINERLPGNLKLGQITMPPKQLINRMMILSYTMGLGARPAIAVRDGLWSLMSSAIFLGPGRMTRALAESFKPESWVRAREAGALLARTNVGEMYGDVMGEMPSGGRNLFDKVTKWSNMLLSPARWAHNFGRNIMFNGEYLDSLDAIRDYRAGRITVDSLYDRTTLAAMDHAEQDRLIRMATDKSIDPDHVAKAWGNSAVDISEWPYRRGTQPMALRYGAGRIFGQYGVWPANYLDFGARVSRLAFTGQPKLAARMGATWLATNFAASSAMEHVGVDSSKWFFLSPMGFAGSPNYEFVTNLLKAPENTQEGREARRAVLEYPLDFVPAASEVEGVLKGMHEQGEEFWSPSTYKWPDARSMTRIMGFKPMDEHVTDRNWQEWLRYQAGFPKSKP